jgi:hypothetical protein
MAEPLLLAESVTVTVTCRTSQGPGGGSRRRHTVTVHPDGTVDTGHDLDSERILAAMGGYLSCLGLVDLAVPAFRRWLLLQHRRVERPVVATGERGPWRCVEVGPCCRRGFPTAREAAEHGRDQRHVAKVCGADPRQLSVLSRAVDVAPAPFATDQHRRLWQCGMHPDVVAGIDARVGAVEELSDEFYLGVMSRAPDMEWLARTMRAADGERTTSAWLAWTYGRIDRRDPQGRARWLSAGMMPSLVLPMMRSPYDVEDVRAFARHWHLTFFGAASELAKWCRSGVTPPVPQLTGFRTEHLAFPPQPPSPQARDRVREKLDPRFAEVSELDVAMALVEYGNAGRAARSLEWGIA